MHREYVHHEGRRRAPAALAESIAYPRPRRHHGHGRLALAWVLAVLAMPGLAGAAASAKSLTVSAEQVGRLGIELGEVRSAKVETTATLPATVIPPLNGRIAAPLPYAGTVLAVHVLPGQDVGKSDPLVTVASRELLEAISRLRQAEAELHAAEAVDRRMASLQAKDIVARDRADEAAAQREKVLAVVEELRRSTSILGIRINTDGSYTATAPRAGRVYEVRSVPGGSVEAMAPGVLIDSGDVLWVEAHVPADLLARVQVGDTVAVKDGPSGRVVSVARALDPGHRSARLLAELDRGDGLFAGQMVALDIGKSGTADGLEVAADALGWIDGAFAVFVRTPGGFAMERVKVRARTSALATIEADLKPGQQVAVTGLSQLEKMSAGE